MDLVSLPFGKGLLKLLEQEWDWTFPPIEFKARDLAISFNSVPRYPTLLLPPLLQDHSKAANRCSKLVHRRRVVNSIAEASFTLGFGSLHDVGADLVKFIQLPFDAG